MPRVTLAAGSFRDSNSVDKFDQVKLERGESRRLWIPNEEIAWMEFRHLIKAPVFQDDGQPLTTERKVRGSIRTVFDMEDGYIGGPICLGDPDALETQELDAAGCPACAGVKRMLDAGIGDARDLRPQQRFAFPVIQYALAKKNDPAKLRNPPNAEILVWALSQWSWQQVDGIRSQAAEILNLADAAQVKLQMVDLCVSNENGYQKIDKIYPSGRAWSHDSDAGRAVKAVVQALWGVVENRPTDEQLKAACGRTADWGLMDQDIRDAEERWHQAVNWGKNPQSGPAGNGYLSNGQQAQSLDDGLGGLLEDTAPPADDLLAGHPGGLDEFASPGQQAAPAAAAPADDDLFGADPAPAAPAAARTAAPADDSDLFGADPVPAAAGANGNGQGAQTFKDILAGIDE